MRLFSAILFGWIVVLLAVGTGWILNMLALITTIKATGPYGVEFFVRLLGVPIVPLGALLGYAM